MKNLITATFLLLVLLLLVVACNGKKQTHNSSTDDNPANSSALNHGHLIEDTVIGPWTIKNYKDSNDIIVKAFDYEIRDSSVYLNISYDNKCIFADKEIRTKDIAGHDGEYIMYSGGHTFWTSDSALYLSFICLKPESDVGWDILYQILPDGRTDIISIEYDMGLDGANIITEFLALYFNELAIGSSDKDIKRLLDNYCTKEFANKIADRTVQLASDSTDFKYAYQTLELSCPDDYIDNSLDKYTLEMSFKPDPKNEKLGETMIVDIDSSVFKIENIEKDMTSSGLMGKLVEKLKSEPYLSGFGLRKRDATFYWDEDVRRKCVELQHWMDNGSLVIRPIYKVRFDILSKWFLPYSDKSLRQHLEQPSYSFTGDKIGCHEKFTISEDNFEQDYSALQYELDKCLSALFSSYATMRDMYETEITPLLDGKRALPDVGNDWVFQYLALSKIVSPEDYPKVKELILSHVHKMAEKQDPYILEYLPRLDEIIAAMEKWLDEDDSNRNY